MVMRVAVIGGGLFGATAAIHAARAGHQVHLFEAKPELMQGATSATFCRLHRGAHYPRSPETGWESRRAEASFRAEYGAAIVDGGNQFYVVPPADSHVTVKQFAEFLDNQGLAFAEDHGIFRVVEPRINLAVLAALVKLKIREAGVHVHLATKATGNDLRSDFDRIVVATYSNLNEVLGGLGCAKEQYRFQVVEKIVALLPENFRDTSYVVVDGPFGCIDPMDATPLHIIGHVTRTIHASNTGHRAIVPPHLLPLIDAGIVRDPDNTRFMEVVEDLAQWIPGLTDAGYLGSQYTVRAVLAHRESTDARPTLTERLDEQVMRVFSGKLGTAVKTAEDIVKVLDEEKALAA